MNLLEFFGRLHPLVVHVPIALLPLAALFYFLGKKQRFYFLQKALPITLFLSAISAVVAVIFGWLLAAEGGFQESALFWHRWMGVAVAVCAVVAWISQVSALKNSSIISSGLLVIGFLLVSITGHLGGALTHGKDYLTQPLFGVSKQEKLQIPTHNDSIMVFTHLVQPVLKKKCYSCHNETKQNGGLNLSSWEAIQKGGKSGSVLHPNIWEAELFKRVTLPQSNPKFMPPSGEALTFAEAAILKWWIANDATPNAQLTSFEVDDSFKDVLLHEYQIDLSPKAFVETVQIAPLDESVITTLYQNKWQLSALAQDNHLLEVKWIGRQAPSKNDIQKLRLAKDHITWLNLSDWNLEDADVKMLQEFSNLSRLRLANNHLTGACLNYLNALKNLESLNLNGNPIQQKYLTQLKVLPNLQYLYLWETSLEREELPDFLTLKEVIL